MRLSRGCRGSARARGAHPAARRGRLAGVASSLRGAACTAAVRRGSGRGRRQPVVRKSERLGAPRRARRLRRTCTERDAGARLEQRLRQRARDLPRGVLVGDARLEAVVAAHRPVGRAGPRPSPCPRPGRTGAGGGTARAARPSTTSSSASRSVRRSRISGSSWIQRGRRGDGDRAPRLRRRRGLRRRSRRGARRRTPVSVAGSASDELAERLEAGLVERGFEVRRQVRRGTRPAGGARNDAS